MARHASMGCRPEGVFLALASIFLANSVPAATPDLMSTFRISAAYHTNLASYHSDWNAELDNKLADMTELIGLDNPAPAGPCDDVNGCVIFERVGDVGFFANPAYEDIDEQGEKDTLIAWLDYNYKIVTTIDVLFGEDGEEGVASGTLRSIIITKYADADTWAHEFGHTQGITKHREDFCKDAVMYNGDDEAEVRDVISETERDRFIQNPDEQRYRCSGITPAWLRYMVADLESGPCRIRFRTDGEFEVEAFKLYRRAGAADTALVATIVPQGSDVSVEYDVQDPLGQLGDVYVLMEDRIGPGRDMAVGECVAVSQAGIPPADYESYDADSLAATLEGQPVALAEPSVPCTEGIPAYAIVCPDSFSANCALYAGLWSWRGVDAKVVTFTRAESCFGGIAEYIDYAAGHGLQAALLVGDASDVSLWDDPTAWTYPGWSFPRETCNGTTGHPPGDSTRNVLPTYYYPDHAHRFLSMAFWTPYYASDLPYSDADSDGLPDVLIGRLPVTSKAALNAYMVKLGQFLSGPGNTIHPECYQVGDARDDLPFAPGFEQEWYMDKVADAVPSGVSLSRFYSRGRMGFGEYVKTGALVQSSNHREAANLAANQGAGVIIWQDTRADRYGWPGWNLWSGWSVAELGVPPRPFVSVGLTCGTANFDMCEYQNWDCDSARIRPLVERVLLDPEKGAIVHIGTTRGSYIQGAGLFGMELIPRLFQPGMNVGTAFQRAFRACVMKYPRFRDQFQSYVLLGDPLIGATSASAAGVPIDGIDPTPTRLRVTSIRPNPFTGSFTAMISGALHRRVTVRVFDIGGRLVRDLGEVDGGSGGTLSISWDGRRSDGGEAGSGIYFIIARSGSEISSGRVVRIK